MSDHGEDQQKYPPLSNLPTHVGIIMDGNGRWAQARGLPRLAGHRAGVENLRRVLRAAVDFGIPILTLYAFSTENWKRPEAEVRGLLHLLREGLAKEVGELHKNGVQLRHLGDLSALPEDLQHRVQDALELTRHNTALIANIAFNYGGRMELVEAMRAIAREGLRPEEITEEVISNHLFTAGLPDPDLIIRTSGEFRISNFLIWQGAYAEYYIPSVYWPDFDKDEFYKALQSFSQRERRYGALSEA
ncbi:MAG TPA: isoprenyl transferase [Anaerolineae bacterium]|nr:isoprenyl transferase [Anaerolineae bacterium]HXK42255.1 isoprenyl transferase [Anaerolineae bacterium]